MAWSFLRGRKFKSQILGLSIRMFRNFWDCFQIVWAKFSGLFSDSLGRIFGTVFGQSG